MSAAEDIPAPDLGTWEDDAEPLKGETRHMVAGDVIRATLRSTLRQELLLTRAVEALEALATTPKADPMAAARSALAAKRAAERGT